VLRRSEGTRFSSPSDDEVGGMQRAIRSERSEQSNTDGLPAPEPQFEIFGPDGRLIARVDFYWKDQTLWESSTGSSSTVSFLNPGSGSRM
jgi:hypothetical protein